MLLAGLPLTDVLAAVGPDERALALSLIINELSCVHLSIFPLELALAFHLILLPISNI